MKRISLLVTVLSLAACNWDDAERRARCTQDPSSCVADAGSADAGSIDAGEAFDAGPPRSVNFPVNGATDVLPIGVYPARDGGVWVVANVDTRGLVQLRNVMGALVRDFSFDGSVVAAYGNGDVYPALAVLREDADSYRRLWLVREDGASLDGGEREATDVSMYFDGTNRVSVWQSANSTLDQFIFDAESLALTTTVTRSTCSVTLDDLEVARPSAGGAVAIVYNSNACDSVNAGEGIAAGRAGGVVTITPTGLRRAALGNEDVKAVGGSPSGELRFLSRLSPTALLASGSTWSGDRIALDDDTRFGASEGILAGDVSGDFVTFISEGSVATGNVVGTNVGTLRQVNVAHVSPWLHRQLGQTNVSRVPLLRHADNVWVLWAPDSGGLLLSNFTPDLLAR